MYTVCLKNSTETKFLGLIHGELVRNGQTANAVLFGSELDASCICQIRPKNH